jgi:hypothetical protein
MKKHKKFDVPREAEDGWRPVATQEKLTPRMQQNKSKTKNKNQTNIGKKEFIFVLKLH